QAVYLQRLRDAGRRDWILVGANLRPDMNAVVAALQAQHGRYTLETVSPSGECGYQTLDAIDRVLPFDPTLADVIACGADPATRIISVTVTEAGYYLDGKGNLDFTLPELAADVSRARNREPGTTVYGAICAILRARHAGGAGPVTLLNCDNLRHNGDRLRTGLMAFIACCDEPALLAWAQANTTCPNGMVDRITPRPPPELRERVRVATGMDDAAAITAESFIQWVIEDRFAAGRPDWETVGVELVDSVLPYEEAKIRILNASHSCIAWAGTLVGLSFIHEGVRHHAIRQMAFDYVTDDVIPCLDQPGRSSPVNLPAYRDSVLERFGNPVLKDTNQRVVMDGFSKIPGFVAPTLRERLAAGASITSAALLPALFLAFLQRWHAGKLAYVYQDQAMDPAAAHAMCESADPVGAFCADRSMWGDLAGLAPLTQAVRVASLRVVQFIKDSS
ncbi:MAG: D-arabinitol 4-dehydrogenase, partial [Polaromonas sp.]|nr:D-arabinitol 4-dehydrogenase [Polaromonas sp.]